MTEAISFPRHHARTRRFTLGQPRTVTVCAGGRRLLFLRSLSGVDPRTALWCVDLPDGEERLVVDPSSWDDSALAPAERARRERVRETAEGVVAYSADAAGRTVVFVAGAELQVADLDTGQRHHLAGTAGAFDPRLDPTGRRIAYVVGGELRVVDIDGGSPRTLVGEPAESVSWGRAEHVAGEEMGRTRGFWWSPDGSALLVTRVDEAAVPTWWIADPARPDTAPRAIRYPAAGADNAAVTLHLVDVDVDGGRRDIGWDTAALPYLARVRWALGHPPLLQVQSRDQRRVATLTVDVNDGGTAVVHDDTDAVWVELFDGVPDWCGEDVVRIVDDAVARRLVVGSHVVTPDDLYVRRVVSCRDDGVVMTASYDDPTQIHVVRWSRDRGLERITTQAGVHAAVGDDGVIVVTSSGLDQPAQHHVVHHRDGTRVLTSVAEQPQLTPAVRMMRVGARDLRAGLVLPSSHRPGDRWPVLLSPYAGPHAQVVLSAQRAWLEPQWLADQGFAVVVTDGRGTPGRDPAWERTVHHDLTATLDDQIDALDAIAAEEPALDLQRVGIRGWSFGGWLAALAVLRRPDVFAAAVAGAPVADWALYDTHYTERYLGVPSDQPDVYSRHSLIDAAAALSRPLLLIHGLADDNVVAAHTLQLSQRLTESGRPHQVLPLTGVTHMTPQEAVAENLLLLQVEFLRTALGGPAR